jgi:hypothetical protein
VHFVDANNGWVVGDDATVLYTKNGGINWNPGKISGTAENLNGVSFFDTNNGWIVGDNAAILCTVDGGKEWKQCKQKKFKNFHEHLRAIHFVDKSNGWIIGDNATIIRIGNDGWVKWNPPNGVMANFQDVHFINNNGWIVGEKSLIFSTEDGNTWKLKADLDINFLNLTSFISSGRIYVDGILCENEQAAAFTTQPDLAIENFYGKKIIQFSELRDFSKSAAISIGESAHIRDSPTRARPYLFYLDVWQRHITALDDPAIREVALGGPDTTTRTKTIWQVKSLSIFDEKINCHTILGSKEWKDMIAPSTGKLLTRTKPDSNLTDPCKMPSRGGYRRLENQLYRVEIHRSDDVSATFKWSRDNGSVASLGNIEDKTIIVSDPGKDGILCFAPGQWVELSDEMHVLRGEPGVFVKLAKVDGKKLMVESWPEDKPPSLSKIFTVRRWEDGERQVEVPADNDGWLELEDGIEIKFDRGSYMTGDYSNGPVMNLIIRYRSLPMGSNTIIALWLLAHLKGEYGHSQTAAGSFCQLLNRKEMEFTWWQ